jgi:hypothetical protein
MRKVALWSGIVTAGFILGAGIWLTATPALLGSG